MLEVAKLLRDRNPANQSDDNYDYLFFLAWYIALVLWPQVLTLHNIQRYSYDCTVSSWDT